MEIGGGRSHKQALGTVIPFQHTTQPSFLKGNIFLLRTDSREPDLHIFNGKRKGGKLELPKKLFWGSFREALCTLMKTPDARGVVNQ